MSPRPRTGQRTALFALFAALSCTRSEAQPAKSSPNESADEGSAAARPPEPTSQDDGFSLEGRDFPLLIACVLVVERGYFDRGRFAPRRQLATAVEQLGMHEPAVLGTVKGRELIVTVARQRRSFALDHVDDLASAADRLEQILVFARDVLKPREEQLRELEYAAINGFLAGLDPHTILLTPDERTELGVRTSGRYGGVGAEIAARDRRIAIVGVLAGTPAEAAGLLAGDLILKIGKQSTVNMTATDAMHLVRGPIDTTVALEIRRGKQLLTFTVARKTIRIDSVRSALLPEAVGYVGLSHFQEDSAEKMSAAIRKMGADAPLRGLILDLRGNAGGLLSEATEVLDLLVDTGELVVVHSSAGREALEAKPGRLLGPETVVVALIDEHSASAAEIVSGAIKHLGRGVVLGRGSFGKGSVQKLLPLEFYDRQVALKQTIAEYRVAGERKIQTVGVSPDVRLHPVRLASFPAVAQYYDEERFERARERFQTASLPSAIHEHGAKALMGRPGPLVPYLDAPPASTPPTDPAERLLADPEIRLSQRAAVTLSGTRLRTDLVAKLPELADRLREEEDTKIVATWREQDIDWRRPQGDVPPQLDIDATLVNDGPIAAGTAFSLSITARNTGSSPVFRVRAMTDCPYDELDGIEVMFGRLDPGAATTRTLSLEVMAWHPDFSDQLTTTLHAGESGKAIASESVRLDVSSNARPRLAFDYWVVDDPKLLRKSPKRGAIDMARDLPKFQVAGNGDGMLGVGEHVLVAFRAYNRGPGPSRETRMMVQNLSGTQGLLEEGLFDLEAIASGASRSGAFGFTVAPDADPKLPVELLLTTADARLRERSDLKVALRVVADRPVWAAGRRSMRAGSEPIRLYNGADPSAPVVATIAADQSLAILGSAGEWSNVAGPDGRRLWAPSDVLTSVGSPARPTPTTPRVLVEPPAISIEPVPTRISAGALQIRGQATHPLGVKNIVAYQATGGPRSRARKIFFRANEQAHDNVAQPLAFELDLELEPGSNRIEIQARDADDVIVEHSVWIYRETP